MIICGSGTNGELTMIDIIGLMSFAIGLENLDINITQEDMDAQTADLDARVNSRLEKALADIHTHLRTQDDKIDELLRRTS